MSLLVDKHARYFKLCLNSLPQKAQSEDSNKLALVYFNLCGLALLGKLDLCDKNLYVNYVYDHLIPLKDTSITAFRSSGTFALDPRANDYDLPNLSSTFFALAILLLFEENFSKKIDRHKIMNFVSRCQVLVGAEKGSFRPVLDSEGNPFGESDLRVCYLAASIRTLVGYDKLDSSERNAKNDIDVLALKSFILDKASVIGGLASSANSEPHSGLTFCGLAALSLLNNGLFDESEPWFERTITWLAHRQVDYPSVLYGMDHEHYYLGDIGGFNGRPNKYSDTCYSWWVMALMGLLRGSEEKVFDVKKASEYLLEKSQHKMMGGFGKEAGAFPDPFHSLLGLASLALIKQSQSDANFDGMDFLEKVDLQLVMTMKLRDFANSLWESWANK